MKLFFTFLLTLTMMTTHAQNGKAETLKKAFSRETAVAIDIQADAAIVWALLTNAADFARWNSTVVSLAGEIALGEKLELVSALDTSRTFKLKVKAFEPEKQLIWGDALGKRTYTLESLGASQTKFTMHEKIGGLMFPLFAGQIPAFDESFEQFAKDLKQEAESIQAEN